jgi:hypothetical protein
MDDVDPVVYRWTNRLFTLALGAAALLSTGCPPGTTTVSCETGANAGKAVAHVCTQYDNEPVDAVTDFDGACTGEPGNACPLTDVLGTCVISDPTYVTTVTARYYSFGSSTEKDAQTACAEQGGLWTSGG